MSTIRLFFAPYERLSCLQRDEPLGTREELRDQVLVMLFLLLAILLRSL